jgi:hypothetical protein
MAPMDVVEAIIGDHVRFESLLRTLRTRDPDPAVLRPRRESARAELAALLIAHARAEETAIYPHLRTLTDAGPHVDHGEDEHLEGHHLLLTLLDVADVLSPAFDKALGKLANSLYHHLDEEERTLLNDARLNLDAATRAALGTTWRTERDRLLASDCGTRSEVAALVPPQRTPAGARHAE